MLGGVRIVHLVLVINQTSVRGGVSQTMVQTRQREAHDRPEKQQWEAAANSMQCFMETSSTVSESDQQNRPQSQKEQDEQSEAEQRSRSLTRRREAPVKRKTWEPSFYFTPARECFHFAGHSISIQESMDTFGALIWPGAIALCQFLENNQQQVDLMDKSVLEIGAGTGLLSVVASLLGARVTATDLPDILPNLTFNLLRNTRGRARHAPRVAALRWGRDLERDFPSARFDYVLAADVVYPHDCLEELLETFRFFCRQGGRGTGTGTALLWANKLRFESDRRFAERLQGGFDAALLAELPQQEVRIYRATAKE